MKISAALLAATCSAEWTKPSYYDFIYKDQGQMRASGMANWGHPVVGSNKMFIQLLFNILIHLFF